MKPAVFLHPLYEPIFRGDLGYVTLCKAHRAYGTSLDPDEFWVFVHHFLDKREGKLPRDAQMFIGSASVGTAAFQATRGKLDEFLKQFPDTTSVVRFMLEVTDPILFAPVDKDPFGLGVQHWRAFEAFVVRAREAFHAAVLSHEMNLGDTDVALGGALEALEKSGKLDRDPGWLNDHEATSYSGELMAVADFRNFLRDKQGVPAESLQELNDRIDFLKTELAKLGYIYDDVHRSWKRNRKPEVDSLIKIISLLPDELQAMGPEGVCYLKDVVMRRNALAHISVSAFSSHARIEGNRVAPIRAEEVPAQPMHQNVGWIVRRYLTALRRIRPQLQEYHLTWFDLMIIGGRSLTRG